MSIVFLPFFPSKKKFKKQGWRILNLCHNIAINLLTAVRWNWTMDFVALVPKQQVRLPTGKDLPVEDAQGSLVLREASNKISSIVSHLQHLSQIMYYLDPLPPKKIRMDRRRSRTRLRQTNYSRHEWLGGNYWSGTPAPLAQSNRLCFL